MVIALGNITMTLDNILTQLEQAGYQHRDNQIAMMRAVSDALKRKEIAVIEGGTGIGKTFAYLIPALLNRPAKTKLIIATATVSLQEQLAYKDLPTVLKLMGISVNAEIAKGRRRYVCANKLYHYSRNDANQEELSLFGIDANEFHKPDKDALQMVAKLIGKLEAKTWNGDRDELDFSVPETEWQQLTTDAAGCSNRRCSFFHQCAFFQAKRRLQQADVVIANHDLLLSDIGLGTGALLPKAEESIYLIDEAHHLPHKAVSHFAASSTLMGSREWLDSLSKSVKQLQSKAQLENSVVEQVQKLAEQLKQDLANMRDVVAANFEQFAKDEAWIIQSVPDSMSTLVKPLMNSAQQLLNQLTAIRKGLMETHNDKTLPEFEAMMVALAWFISRIEMLYRTWTLFAMELPKEQAPIARWITAREQVKGKKFLGQDYVCHAAMTSGANLLPTYFWDKLNHGAILCSATLRALGKFEDFLEKTGLNFYPHVKTYAFTSPFFYQKSTVVVPKMQHLPEGKESDKHAREIGELLPKILANENHGVLVLFTSKWLLEEVYQAMPSSLLSSILKQGDSPKQLLLDQHRKRIDEGKRSFIFGMQSFAEGVDLPGDYCRHVVITKLPFAVPSTPIEKVRVDWLEAQGRNAFMEHSLPEASIRLTQYAGRLIRSEQDVGKVTILDRRIVSKRYGSELLNNLPPFQRVIE
jgi:ATP-dependent DNA helicase DinG